MQIAGGEGIGQRRQQSVGRTEITVGNRCRQRLFHPFIPGDDLRIGLSQAGLRLLPVASFPREAIGPLRQSPLQG